MTKKQKQKTSAKVSAKKTAIVKTDDKQDKIVELKLDNRITDKSVRTYVDSLPDSYDKPKQSKREPYCAWVVISSTGLLTAKKRSFTENEFIAQLAKISGKSVASIVAVNKRGKASAYPDGHIHRGLYGLACIAQATMKTKTGKGNSMGSVKNCLVRVSADGAGKVSIDKGNYEVHPLAHKDLFKPHTNESLKQAVSFLIYND